MSLYSDLNEVLTPYAQRIKGLAAADEEIKTDLDDFMNDSIKEFITPTWSQNRIMASNNVLTEVESGVFINSGFIETDKSMTIDVPSGYSAYAWRSAYNELGHTANRVTSSWSTGTIQYEYNPTFPYLIICVQKSPSAPIVPSDGEAVKIIYEVGQSIYATKSTVNELSGTVEGVSDVANRALSNTFDGLFTLAPDGRQIIYNADDKVSSGHIGNAVMRDNGVIVAGRSSGTVVEIGYSGTESTLLSVNGSGIDWRCLFKDSKGNIYCAPHATFGTLTRTDRGLYRLENGVASFVKVISLYDTSSSIASETETNDDTIWAMCEDANGNLYAGVYAHSVRANPAIYKSTDSGLTWTYIFNFKTAGLTSNGMHIHSIVYSKWQDALYCIVGEVNTIFKSTDGATTWTDLHVELASKGSAMLATENGILIGSDNTRYADIDILFSDDVTHKRVFRGWANTVFAIRRSDVTGFIYAFTKIDTSVNNSVYYPPTTVLSAADPWDVVNAWRETINNEVRYNAWLNYYNSTKDVYPEDAFIPTHYGIIVSRDGGRTWDVLKTFEATLNTQTGQMFTDGCLSTGYFKNGECLTGRTKQGSFVNPTAISEGKHKYTANGIDLSGEILARTNTSNYVTV